MEFLGVIDARKPSSDLVEEALALHGEERVLPLKEGKKEGNNIFGSTRLYI
jgi:hypothetical protein